MTCKFRNVPFLGWTLELWGIFYDWIRMNKSFGSVHQGVWVWDPDLLIWFPAELLCCLTGTCTNSLSHGTITDHVADFSSCAASISVTNSPNECKLSLFPPFTPFTSSEISEGSPETDTFCSVWATACQFWSMCPYCSLHWEVLLNRAKLDIELTAVCKCPDIQRLSRPF